MKTDATLKNILGLTQEEAAYLLGIERGLWSMYVSGKRALPLAATQQLTVLLKHLQESKGKSKQSEEITKAEQKKMQEQLQQDYLKVQVKHYKVDKQISTIENIRAECFAALEVAAFLEHQEAYQAKEALAKGIRARVASTLRTHNLYALTALRLKKQELEMLKNTLKQKMMEGKNEL
ncbi:hypothetical protein LZZ90_01280 [Flavobacterium sp. SM15]|uniref:hypothetical protein n=1 Tax=Flavobacterium sp. SM15 TaxID=2908005 RepID=UPI001EDB41B7|nr:hypothetical protein [Flavobacterium sp. SM15]MCG2610133.1 hypothetical protein [Flavobacterium sp. SM15]